MDANSLMLAMSSAGDPMSEPLAACPQDHELQSLTSSVTTRTETERSPKQPPPQEQHYAYSRPRIRQGTLPHIIQGQKARAGDAEVAAEPGHENTGNEHRERHENTGIASGNAASV